MLKFPSEVVDQARDLADKLENFDEEQKLSKKRKA
jgi:hypothetical protein